MQKKRFLAALLVWAALCTAALILGWTVPALMSSALSFPLQPIAQGLRALSLTGTPGNAAALGLYVLLSLSPLLGLVLARLKRSFYWEDLLAALLCPFLFATLYLLINPQLLTLPIDRQLLCAILGGIFYSTLTGYLLLRFLRAAFHADEPRLRRLLSLLLYAVGAIFVSTLFYVLPQSLKNALDALYQANSGNERALGLTVALITFRHVFSAISYILDLWVTMAVLPLASAEAFSAQAVAAAETLAGRCKTALTVSVCLSVAVNLLQFLFINRLYDLHASLDIPLLPTAFVLAALLLAGHIRKSVRIKQENDLFI